MSKIEALSEQVFAYIETRYLADRIPPTIREIADHCGLTVGSTLTRTLTALEQAGRLEKAGGLRGRYLPNTCRVVRDADWQTRRLEAVDQRLREIEAEFGIRGRS